MVQDLSKDTIVVVSPCPVKKENSNFRRVAGYFDGAGLNWEELYWSSLREVFANTIIYDRTNNLIEKGVVAMNDEILQIVQREKPLYVLFYVIDEHLIPENTFSKIRKMGSKTIMLFGDESSFFEVSSKYLIPCLDYIVVLGEKPAVENYKQYGAPAILTPVPASRHLFHKLSTSGYKYDVSFVGSSKFDRGEMIEKIRAAGIPVDTFGNGWEGGDSISNAQMNEIFNTTKINLNFTKNRYGVPHAVARTYELPCTGGFMLTEYSPGMEMDFEIGKEIDCFKNAEECIEKIKYYLSHDAEREAMAEKAYVRAVNNFWVEKVFKKLFEVVKEDQYLNTVRSIPAGSRGAIARRLGRKVMYAASFYLDKGKGVQWRDFMAQATKFAKEYSVNDKKIMLMLLSMKCLPYFIGKRVVAFGYNLRFSGLEMKMKGEFAEKNEKYS